MDEPEFWTQEGLEAEYQRRLRAEARTEKVTMVLAVLMFVGFIVTVGLAGMVDPKSGEEPSWVVISIGGWIAVSGIPLIAFLFHLITLGERVKSLSPLTKDQAKTILDYEREIPEVRPYLAGVRKVRRLTQADFQLLEKKVTEAWRLRANQGLNSFPS